VNGLLCISIQPDVQIMNITRYVFIRQLIFGVFDASAPVGGAVTGLEGLLQKVFIASLRKYKDWGGLSDQTGQKTVLDFIDSCRAFSDCLQSKLL